MQIREYTDDDWPSIWPIFREVVTAGDTYAYDPDWSSEQAREIWVEGATGHTVVACDGSRVLGTAKMGPNRPGRGAHVATASFMVDEVARGRGVGRALLDALQAEARALGLRRLVLETGVRQSAAIALYRRCGFADVPAFGEYVASPLSICMAKEF